MEIDQEMKDRVGMYAELVRYIHPMVKDVYGVVILQEIGKDVRCDRCITNRNTNDDEPATTKQIDYLKSLGVSYADEVTKKEASELIEEAKSGQGLADKSTGQKE